MRRIWNGRKACRAGAMVLCAGVVGVGACSSGSTLYDVARKGESRDAAVRFIEKGADVNEANPDNGWTPLHVAAANGHPKMCETLIEYGANVNAKDVNGMTPLHLAMARGHSKTGGVLLGAGADPSIKNDQGKTADEMAPN